MDKLMNLNKETFELKQQLIKLAGEYDNLTSRNNRVGSGLKHRIDELRKTLGVLNDTTHFDDLYELKKNKEASHRYIKDQEQEHGVNIYSMDTADFDKTQKTLRTYGFSDKFIDGKTLVQLVQFYIKNVAK